MRNFLMRALPWFRTADDIARLLGMVPPLPQTRPIELEIDLIKRAIARRDYLLDVMLKAMHPDDCCPSCRYGLRYTELADKNERAAAWLAILEAKRARHSRTHEPG